MWFTPCLSKISSVASASACETEPSAAAPKIVRVLSWPVLPNAAVAITALPYVLSRSREGARFWPPRSSRAFTDLLRVRGASPRRPSECSQARARTRQTRAGGGTDGGVEPAEAVARARDGDCRAVLTG